MTKNKAYLVNQLCALRRLDPESDEAKELYSLKIIDLLTEIKKNKGPEPEPVQKKVEEDREDPEEDEEDDSLARRLGCT